MTTIVRLIEIIDALAMENIITLRCEPKIKKSAVMGELIVTVIFSCDSFKKEHAEFLNSIEDVVSWSINLQSIELTLVIL